MSDRAGGAGRRARGSASCCPWSSAEDDLSRRPGAGAAAARMRTGQLAPRRPSCRHRRGRRWNRGSLPALPGVEGRGPRLTGGDIEWPGGRGKSDRRRGELSRVSGPCGPGGCAERRPSPGRAEGLRGCGPWMRRQRRGTAGARPRPGEEAASGATAAAAASEEEGSPPRARPSSQPFLLGIIFCSPLLLGSPRSKPPAWLQRLGLVRSRCLRYLGLEAGRPTPWARP